MQQSKNRGFFWCLITLVCFQLNGMEVGEKEATKSKYTNTRLVEMYAWDIDSGLGSCLGTEELYTYPFQKGNIKSLEYLLSKGFDVNKNEEKVSFPLFLAIKTALKDKDFAALNLLLEHESIQLTIDDEKDGTPLGMALVTYDTEENIEETALLQVIELLLSHKDGDVLINNQNMPALYLLTNIIAKIREDGSFGPHWDRIEKLLPILDCLLCHGEDPYLKNTADYQCAVDVAKDASGLDDFMEYACLDKFKQKGGIDSSIHADVLNHYLAWMFSWDQRSGIAHYLREEGLPSAIIGHKEVLNYLVSKGFDINRSFGWNTPIELAACMALDSDLEILKMLLERKDIQLDRDIFRSLFLDWSRIPKAIGIQRSNVTLLQIVQLVLSHKDGHLLINRRTTFGHESSLYLLIRIVSNYEDAKKLIPVFGYLLKNGENPYLNKIKKNKKGKNAIDLADEKELCGLADYMVLEYEEFKKKRKEHLINFYTRLLNAQKNDGSGELFSADIAHHIAKYIFNDGAVHKTAEQESKEREGWYYSCSSEEEIEEE